MKEIKKETKININSKNRIIPPILDNNKEYQFNSKKIVSKEDLNKLNNNEEKMKISNTLAKKKTYHEISKNDNSLKANKTQFHSVYLEIFRTHRNPKLFYSKSVKLVK